MTLKKRLFAVSSAMLLAIAVSPVAFADDLSANLFGGGGQGVASIQTLNASNLNYAIFAAGIGNITNAQILQGNAVVITLGSGSGGVATGSASGNVSDITNNPGNYSVRVQGTSGTVTGDLVFAAESGDGGGDPGDGRIDTGDTSPCAAPGAAVLDGQFCITGFLTDQAGQDRTATFIQYTSDTVLAYVFAETNIEFLVKLPNGTCDINDVQWVFAGGATDLAGEVVVREVATGLARVYTFGSGPFMTINDTQEGQACPEA